MITAFKDENRWLSNLSPCSVILDGIEYYSVENAYQSAKSINFDVRSDFVDVTPPVAAFMGHEIDIRADWDIVRLSIMKELLIQKFSSIGFKTKLLDTGSVEIQKGNISNDVFWGVDLNSGIGENMLGKIIMDIRTNYLIYKESFIIES